MSNTSKPNAYISVFLKNAISFQFLATLMVAEVMVTVVMTMSATNYAELTSASRTPTTIRICKGQLTLKFSRYLEFIWPAYFLRWL